MTTRITLMMTTTDPEQVARSTEHFARAAAGLALEGVEITLMIGPDEEEVAL
jgi:hypothetical protein